jgi:hypothetical protein
MASLDRTMTYGNHAVSDLATISRILAAQTEYSKIECRQMAQRILFLVCNPLVRSPIADLLASRGLLMLRRELEVVTKPLRGPRNAVHAEIPFELRVWNGAQVAEYLGYEKNYFMRAIRWQVGFPPQLDMPGYPRWMAKTIADWVLDKQSKR